MFTKTQNEITRLKKNTNVQVSNTLGDAAPRAAMREMIADGDVINFPTDLTDRVVTQKIRGTEDTVSYLLCDVTTKAGKEVCKPFYLSSFWKGRQKYDEATKMPTGEYVNASGDVCDFIQDFDRLDDAVIAIGNKGPVVATLNATIKTMPYGGIDGETALKNDSIFNFNWK